jgi:UDP-N-acetylmuramate--alanine ligase
MFTSSRKVHFVGIGGIGMSAIAEILLAQKFSVSGSDLRESENTEYLRKLGAEIFIGHKAENINGADVVVYSSAVKVDENTETKAAFEKNIPVLRRAEMLAEVTRLKYCLAVSGTHGKTTTTSMCGITLMQAGFEPTVIVGGRLGGLGGSNARLGDGDWTVVEADEYDRSFLQLLPTVAIINNIEPEHMDIYENYEDLKQTFVQFANKVPFYGFIAACIDDEGIKEILPEVKKKIITFGLSKSADYRGDNIRHSEFSTEFDVFNKGKELGTAKINIPGEHNVKNALATISVGLELGLDFDVITKALASFTGVNRRFEIKGQLDGMLIIDDYAHHPTEIKATLKAAKDGFGKRIIAVFQPHTYTRTAEFYKDFARSFDDADILIVTDVYAAREKPIEGITGKLVADFAQKYNHRNVYYCPTISEVYDLVLKLYQSDDMLITLGAGDIWKLNEKLIKTKIK